MKCYKEQKLFTVRCNSRLVESMTLFNCLLLEKEQKPNPIMSKASDH